MRCDTALELLSLGCAAPKNDRSPQVTLGESGAAAAAASGSHTAVANNWRRGNAQRRRRRQHHVDYNEKQSGSLALSLCAAEAKWLQAANLPN